MNEPAAATQPGTDGLWRWLVGFQTLGDLAKALAVSQEAVTLHRKLVGLNAEAFVPQLASALDHLSQRLSDFGRREEALAASEEARTCTPRKRKARLARKKAVPTD